MSVDPENIRGAVTVYRPRRSAVYRIQPMAIRGRLGLAESGAATEVPSDDQAELLVRIDEALATYKSNRYGSEGSPRFAAKEYAAFVRDNDSVMIVRHDDDRLELIPHERIKGGYKAISPAGIMLHAPITAGTLADALREAFVRCQ